MSPPSIASVHTLPAMRRRAATMPPCERHKVKRWAIMFLAHQLASHITASASTLITLSVQKVPGPGVKPIEQAQSAPTEAPGPGVCECRVGYPMRFMPLL